jgi:hypothetical protein
MKSIKLKFKNTLKLLNSSILKYFLPLYSHPNISGIIDIQFGSLDLRKFLFIKVVDNIRVLINFLRKVFTI